MLRNLKKMSRLIPRALRYRLGRALYMDARGDVPNEMATNGELFLQRCVIDGWSHGRQSGNRLVVFDAGANRGDWTAHLLACCTQAKPPKPDVVVVAFEPDPTAAAYLRKRFAGDSRVRIEQVGLSSKSESVKFYSSGPALGTNSLYATDGHYECIIEVTTERLADYCARHDIRRIDLVKCDTEGHDYEVILGALDLLSASGIPIFQFEYNYRWVFARRFLRDVFDLITGLPYKLGKLQPNHVIVYDHWHFELERYFEGNYVLLHERAMQSVPVRRAAWDKSNAMRVARREEETRLR